MFFFFFKRKSRHTILQGDWSSDVCSSDLGEQARRDRGHGGLVRLRNRDDGRDILGAPKIGRPVALARSEERRVGKSVDLGGRRIIKKKKKKKREKERTIENK